MHRVRGFAFLGIVLLLGSCAPQGSIPLAPSEQTASGADVQEQIDQTPLVVIPANVQTGTGDVRETLLPSGIVQFGKSGAPHTLLLVTNHACPYCRQFELDQFTRLKRDFIDTGLLTYEVTILPLKKYPESKLFAQSLTCAARQGRGMVLHSSLFSLQPRNEPAVLKLVKDRGLDVDAFTSCLHDPATWALVDREEATLKQLGITLVPTFILDEQAETGLPDYADLRGRITAAIAAGPASSRSGP